MTTLEDQVRHSLHDMADDVQPVHFLSRLDRVEARAHRRPTRRRMAVVAAAVVAAVATGSVLLLRLDRPSIIEPVQRPPKVLHLSDSSAKAPGRAILSVVLARNDAAEFKGELPNYLLPATGRTAVLLETPETPTTWTWHLSADGTRLVQQYDAPTTGLEIVNIVTGAVNRTDLPAGDWGCPELSPDNRTVAMFVPADGVALLDVGSGSRQIVSRRPVPAVDPDCVPLAWSPDGRLLTAPDADGSVVIDRRGRVQHRLSHAKAVNGSMAWSPDGRAILLYVSDEGHFVVRQVGTSAETVLVPPADVARPLGWAGSRVVWLVGQPGDQRLVTTDQRGGDARDWMRLDVGAYPVETISWSRDLSGTARD